MDESFEDDVCICHGTGDVSSADNLAERLKDDGLRAWCLSKPRGSGAVDSTTERRLQATRSLVLLISPGALRSDWPWLHRISMRFRDPADYRRTFIPVVLEDCLDDVPEVLRRYRLLRIGTPDPADYRALVEACSSKQPDARVREDATRRSLRQSILALENELGRHHGGIHGLTVTSDGRQIVSASSDTTARVWDIGTGNCCSIKKRTNPVSPVALSPDGKRAATIGPEGVVHVWDIETGELNKELDDGDYVEAITWFADGRLAVGTLEGAIILYDGNLAEVASTRLSPRRRVRWIGLEPRGNGLLVVFEDGLIALWKQERERLEILTELQKPILSCAYNAPRQQIVYACADLTIGIWDVPSRTAIATLEGHRDTISGLTVSPDGNWAASCDRHGIRLWDLDEGVCIVDLGTGDATDSVSFSPDGDLLVAATGTGNIFVFRLANQHILKSLAPSAAATRYTNAKVVLVGESTIGKSCLGYRLVDDRWVVEESTHGMRVWPLSLPGLDHAATTKREVWLWDLAGQPEYRLVHQLFLKETALALVLFDPSQPDDPFRGIGHWLKALRLALKHKPTMLLVATKLDRGAASITQAKILDYVKQEGFSGYLRTSAKTGEGRKELLQAISASIPWNRTPWISTPRLFKSLKDAIVKIAEGELVLLPFSALRQQLQLMCPKLSFGERDLRTVVRLLEGQGLIMPLAFGDLILLRPELLNDYAAAVIRAAREHIEGIGCISERRVLDGQFDFKDMPRLPAPDEQVLLRAVVQTFLDHSLCILQETTSGDQLVFPSQFNRELEIPEAPVELVIYRFSGQLPTVYATLVVRLRYCNEFQEPELWKNAAVFRTHSGFQLGLVMLPVSDGVGQIKVFFEPDVAEDTRITFIRYIHEHLSRYAIDIERERRYTCPECGEAFESQRAIASRLQQKKSFIRCVYCDAEIPLYDLIEQRFGDDHFRQRVRELDDRAGINLRNDSKDLILIGDVSQRCGEADQIFRATPRADYGIDGEIEFVDDQGKPSGKRVYLQLKSGDSYLYARRHDGQEIFTIKDDRHLDYWQDQAYPVFLVIRSSDGNVRWMNITDYLRCRSGRVPKAKLKKVRFEGEEFTASNVLRMREQALSRRPGGNRRRGVPGR